MKMKKAKKGFTLIELIVVVAVLAILAAVAVPMISSWVATAQKNEADANARTVELAVKAYMAEKAYETPIAEASGSGIVNDAVSKFGINVERSSSGYLVDKNVKVTLGGTPGSITYSH